MPLSGMGMRQYIGMILKDPFHDWRVEPQDLQHVAEHRDHFGLLGGSEKACETRSCEAVCCSPSHAQHLHPTQTKRGFFLMPAHLQGIV